MPDPEIRIVMTPAEGGTRIELTGELDVASAPELLRRVDQIMDAGGDVWLDCSGLTFADSSGLNVFTRLATALRAQDRRLILTDVRPVVRQAMDVLQITELFEIE